jgi:hypothetical protein
MAILYPEGMLWRQPATPPAAIVFSLQAVFRMLPVPVAAELLQMA